MLTRLLPNVGTGYTYRMDTPKQSYEAALGNITTRGDVTVTPASGKDTPQQKLQRQYPQAVRSKKPKTAFTIRIDIDLMVSLRAEAERQQRRSVNNLVQWLVADYARRVQHREQTGELPPPPA